MLICDCLKIVLWIIWLYDGSCLENSVEYFWYFVLLVLMLVEYVFIGIDVGCVVCLLLMYDLVEIGVGDLFFDVFVEV